MRLGELNLDKIKSHLIESMSEDESWEEVIIQNDLISQKILEDFNNRNIDPNNFNEIHKLCDWLLIDNSINFFAENCKPLEESFKIDYNHPYQEEINGKLPKYLTEEDKTTSKSFKSCFDFDNLEWFIFL